MEKTYKRFAAYGIFSLQKYCSSAKQLSVWIFNVFSSQFFISSPPQISTYGVKFELARSFESSQMLFMQGDIYSKMIFTAVERIQTSKPPFRRESIFS